MKIWITEIGEPLLIETGARLHRNGNLARALVKQGHEVVLWTSNFSHAKKEFLRPTDSVELVDGVELRILAGPGYKRNVSFQRFSHQAHFARRFFEEANKISPPDLILSPVPTLEAAEKAVQYGKQHGVPVVTDIRDEWPEEFVDLAPKVARPLARLLLTPYFRQIRYVCQNVQGIAGISKRQLAYGIKYSGRSAVAFDRVIPLGYPVEPIDEAAVEQATAWWRQQGVDPNAFVGCFFGTIGKFFNLETVIESARALASSGNFQFIMAGDGSSLGTYRQMAKATPQVIFPGWVDRAKITALMRMAKFGLAPYAADTRMSLPNKPFEYLSGGLPVVSSAKGDIEEILEQHHCGLNYEANDAKDLTAKILRLAGNPEETRQMGERGRAVLLSRYSTDAINRGYGEYLEQVRAHYVVSRAEKAASVTLQAPFPAQT